MYALLFAQGETLSDATFSKLVTQLDLNPDKFSSDFMSESVKQRILKDVNDGNRFGVNATPTFFLNGKKLELSSYDQLKTAVDAAVKGLK
jgi:protein-disulfide isomerase